MNFLGREPVVVELSGWKEDPGSDLSRRELELNVSTGSGRQRCLEVSSLVGICLLMEANGSKDSVCKPLFSLDGAYRVDSEVSDGSGVSSFRCESRDGSPLRGGSVICDPLPDKGLEFQLLLGEVEEWSEYIYRKVIHEACVGLEILHSLGLHPNWQDDEKRFRVYPFFLDYHDNGRESQFMSLQLLAHRVEWAFSRLDSTVDSVVAVCGSISRNNG